MLDVTVPSLVECQGDEIDGCMQMKPRITSTPLESGVDWMLPYSLW